MRHNMHGRKLGRPTDQRLALFSNLACSLIEHEQITTTLAKAKDLRSFVEKMITLGKKNTLASRRQAGAFLRHEEAVKKIFDVLAPRYKSRAGGYTRVMKAGARPGDAADIAIIELVERDAAAKGKRQKDFIAKNASGTSARDIKAAAERAAAKAGVMAGERKAPAKEKAAPKQKVGTTPKAAAHRKVIGP